MTRRLIALGAALTFAASSVAQAAPLPAASETTPNASSGRTAAAWVDPPAKMAVKQPAAAPAAPVEAAPQAKVAAREPIAEAPEAPPAKPVVAEAPPAIALKPAARVATRHAPIAGRGAARSRDAYRVRYAGGDGGAWRAGRNAFGFSGSYGGCRFTGFAGPNGYRIDRVC